MLSGQEIYKYHNKCDDILSWKECSLKRIPFHCVVVNQWKGFIAVILMILVLSKALQNSDELSWEGKVN